MSRAQRLGLIAVAVAIAAMAFVLARPDDGDDRQAGSPAPAGKTPARESEPTATVDARPEQRVVLRDHKPSSGVERIEVRKGDLVRLVVESDAADEIHLHGYDIEKSTGPESPARFSFRARIEGVFELESHQAEHGGGDPLVARLVVEPS